MIWRVLVSPAAMDDLRNIRRTVFELSLEENVADRVIERIRDRVSSLSQMPLAHNLHPDPAVGSRGLRYAVSGPYVVVFFPDESTGVVEVRRVLHQRQDTSRQEMRRTGLNR